LDINKLTVTHPINFLDFVIVVDVFTLHHMYSTISRIATCLMTMTVYFLHSQNAERLNYTTQHKYRRETAHRALATQNWPTWAAAPTKHARTGTFVHMLGDFSIHSRA
jgi:hypothetical protein